MKTKVIKVLIMVVLLGLPFTIFSETGQQIPDYSTTDRQDVPREFKWSIEDLYPSIKAWEKDKAAAMKMLENIKSLAPGWITSPEKMLTLLNHLKNLRIKGYRLYAYASHRSNMDMRNQKFQLLKGEMRNMFVQFGTMLAFMNPDILKLGEKIFYSYLKAEPGLKPYRFSIEQVLRMKNHILPPGQQKIVSMSGLFSGASSQASGMLNNVEMPQPEVILSDGTKIKLNYANYARYRSSVNQDDRRQVMHIYWKNSKMFENTLAILLDSGIKQDLFNSRVYGYKDCLDARLYGENIDPRVYHNLIQSVRNNLGSLHRYLILKKQLLGLDVFLYEDIYTSSVSKVDKKYPFSEARDIILQMMKPLGKEYLSGLQKAFNERWIDIYPNKGKQSGAYSGGTYGVHPFIKMNYDGSYSSVSTLAHELGHALHSYLSNKYQHFTNSHYPTFLAEIASTFNENLLVHYLLKNEKDDLFKLYILDGYLERIRATLHRQTLFAEFELTMHRQVEAGKTLTADLLNQKYLELTRYYYGHDQGIVKVGDFIQNEWSGIPHFYRNYYVFQYSTGIIASMALSNRLLHDKKFDQQQYLDFLKAGGSRFPMDTLRLAGVDMTSPEPIISALNQYDQLVREMEKIVKRLKNQNKL